MMKKLLLLSSVALALSFNSTAQNGKKAAPSQGSPYLQITTEQKTSATTTTVTDELHYYLNKVYYKEGNTNIANFPSYKSAASTATGVSHVGSRFDVPAGDSIVITGLEAYARKHPGTISNKVKINIILCNLDANGLPDINNKIDSVVTELSGPGSTTGPNLIGGNFTTPRKIFNSYAILFRNMSTISGDTVYLYRTNGATSNSSADPKYKYSDEQNGKDYGFVRYSKNTPGSFYSTRNFTLDPGFGNGTQYEFIVAPRVNYILKSRQILPAGVVNDSSLVAPDTFCTRQVMTFTNTSSKFYEHRMFNLNAFYCKWALGSPFLSQPSGGWSPDSAITWSFEFFDAVPNQDSRVFLPYTNNGTITAVTDLSYYPACFTNNEFRARLRPMGAFNTAPQIVVNESFTVCLRYCNGDTVGVKENSFLANLSVYPNPAVNGQTTISGLEGTNTIQVFNLLGQAIINEQNTKSQFAIDLSKYPQGTYLVRITNADNQTRTIKILNQN